MEKTFGENQIKGKYSSVCKELLFCAVAALLPLILCSKSSPLYPFNDWPDVNIFFTLGKGMFRGRLPYVDLLEQKGPYIFLLTGVGYLLSKDSFYGYFLFECLSIFFFVYYIRKTVCLYTKTCPWWLLPLLSGAVVSSKSFVHGGSIEELSMGILAYAIYSLLCFLRQGSKERMSLATIFWNGIWAGILLWSKFTLSGLYLAWISVVLAVCLWRRKGKDFLMSVGVFLAAVLLTTIPWLIYFGWHHAIGDWLKVYVWNNIFGYTSGGESSVLSRLRIAILNALRSLKDRGNWCYSLPLAIGCMGYVCLPNRKVSLVEKLSVIWMGLGLALGIFVGGTKHDYYGLPLAVFVMFTGILVGIFWDWLTAKRKRLQSTLCTAALCVMTFALTIAEVFLLSSNVYLMFVNRGEMPQYRFAERIKVSEETTILNYGFLDGGFYTVLDQVPTVPVFCILNINPSQQMEQQNEYVKQKLTHWVVTWNEFPISEEELKARPVLSEYYELVDYQYFYFEGNIRTYALFEVKTD